MIVTVQIACDNAAFDDHKEEEIARIVKEFADDLLTQTIVIGDSFTLRDANGNEVGQATVGE